MQVCCIAYTFASCVALVWEIDGHVDKYICFIMVFMHLTCPILMSKGLDMWTCEQKLTKISYT
jgi:hypothetical protein